jgi:hypothetical protein
MAAAASRRRPQSQHSLSAAANPMGCIKSNTCRRLSVGIVIKGLMGAESAKSGRNIRTDAQGGFPWSISLDSNRRYFFALFDAM